MGKNTERVKDPTENVLRLVDMATKRQDDLLAIHVRSQQEDMHEHLVNVEHMRAAESKRIDEMLDMRAKHFDEQRIAEKSRIDEQMDMRERHSEEQRITEAKRLDAIRAVDAAAVQTAAVAAENRATTLAQQVATAADTLRTVVAAAAIQSDTALKAETDPIKKDVVDLRRYQYEGVGQKQQVVETRDNSSNRGIYIAVGAASFFSFFSIVVSVSMFFLGR